MIDIALWPPAGEGMQTMGRLPHHGAIDQQVDLFAVGLTVHVAHQDHIAVFVDQLTEVFQLHHAGPAAQR